MKRYLALFILLCSLTLTLPLSGGSPLSSAVQAEGGAKLYLQAAVFAPSRGETPDIPGSLRAEPRDAGSAQPYLLQLGGPVQEAWKKQLKSLGVVLLDYIPEYAFKAEMTPLVAKRVQSLPFVAWVGDFHPAYKLSPALSSGKPGWYRVTLSPATSASALRAGVETLGGQLLDQEGSVAVLQLDSTQLQALARLPEVAWVEPFTPMQLYNERGASEMRAPAAWNLGWSGEGQILAIADSGVDTGVDSAFATNDIHGDLDNRFAQIYSWPLQPWLAPYLNNPYANDGASDKDTGHGTHVTGSAAGNGARSGGVQKGIAYRATLAFQSLEQYADFNALGEALDAKDGYGLWGVPTDLNELFSQAYGWGARVHTNSWGGGEAGVYEDTSAQVDQFIWNHKDMTILFAAGNDGKDGDANGRVDEGSVSAPGTAKNALTIGASENLRPVPAPNADSGTYGSWWGGDFAGFPLRNDPLADAGARGMAGFSSRGPTDDGRIKPDLVAPGTWILSTRSSLATYDGWGAPPDPYYMYMGGTSMATPLAAGAATVVREFYSKEKGLPNPSAALIKATLINSATDMPGQYTAPYGEAGPIPNASEGWGVLNLQAAVEGAYRGFSDGNYPLYSGQEKSYQVQIGSSERPFKVTLVWSDYPSSLAAAINLVNDLDLRVIAPDGSVYLGNVFQNSWSTGGGAPDRRNNVECVYLPTPQVGTYQIQIQGFNIPQGPQPFALVYSGNLHSGPLPTATPTQPSCNPLAGLDAPAAGATLSGEISVEGWTIDPNCANGTGVAAVEVWLDGHKLGQAAYALWRQDIALGWGTRFGASGYRFIWDTRASSEGAHTLEIRSLGDCGWATTVQRSVTVRQPAQPTATPTRPMSYRRSLPLLLKPLPPATATPTPTPTGGPQLLYLDDFSNPASGWPTVDDDGQRGGYLNGEYQMWIKQSYLSAVTPPRVQFGDGDIRVEARFASPAWGAYGVSFEIMGSPDLYLFLVNASQSYSLFRISGAGWEPLVDWMSSPYLLAGQATNHLRLVHDHYAVSLYANGSYLNTVIMSEFSGDLRVGLTTTAYGEANVDARFDNFGVYALAEGAWSQLEPGGAMRTSRPPVTEP